MMRYGHLRPGTYDILSNRYDQIIDILSGATFPEKDHEVETLQLTEAQRMKISKLLLDAGFDNFQVDDLFQYIREAIVAREYAKFIFTRSVSDILEVIASYAVENGLSRDEISHVPLLSILETVKSSGEVSVEEHLRNISESGKERHQVSSAIRLPQLLVDEAAIHVVPFQVSQPNFITLKSVTGSCLILSSEMTKVSLDGKVILIEGADPGFDWIFSQNIGGLITKYGGANSHMAIRCAEFGIPAAIGCGEQRFDAIMKFDRILLDCASGLIDSLN